MADHPELPLRRRSWRFHSLTFHCRASRLLLFR
jgi:hypothetical protein